MTTQTTSFGARTLPWVGTAIRLVLAGIFGWAGLAKVGDLAASVRSVRAFEILPDVLEKPVGYALPVIEIAIAVLLVLGLLTRYAAAAGALLAFAFTIGIISVWARGISIDCGCFGGGGPTEPDLTQYPAEVVRDVAMTVAAGFLAIRHRTRFSLDHALGLVVDEA